MIFLFDFEIFRIESPFHFLNSHCILVLVNQNLVFVLLFSCSDQIDPFNRKSLTMEEVVPNPELKQQIEEWKQEQKQKTK